MFIIGRKFLLWLGLVLVGFEEENIVGDNSVLLELELKEIDEDNGFLIVLEVIGLKLLGIEFVVLLVCDIGRGGISFGEGVYGLWRVFFIVGF